MVDPVKRALQIISGQRPTGLAFDASHHRCSLPPATGSWWFLIRTPASSSRSFGSAGASTAPPIRFRAAARLTANGLGSMTMIRHSPDRYHVREDAATRFGRHSLVLDPFIHRIYIAYFGSVAVYEAVPGE